MAGSMVRDPWSTVQASVGISGICSHFNNPHKAFLRAWNDGMDSGVINRGNVPLGKPVNCSMAQQGPSPQVPN